MNDSRIIRRLFVDLFPFRFQFFGALALYFPAAVCALLQPVVIGVVVTKGIGNKDAGAVLYWASIYLALLVLHGFFEMSQLFLMQRAGQGLVRNLRSRMFAKIQRLPVQYFDKTPLGRILTRVTSDSEAIAELFSSGAVQIAGDLLFLVGTFVMLTLIHSELALWTTLMLPILAVGLSIFRRLFKKAYRSVRSALSDLNAYGQEYLSGMGTVQLFAQNETILRNFSLNNDAFLRANRGAILLDASVYSFVDAMSYLTLAFLFWHAFDLHNAGALEIGVLVAFIEALNRFFQPLRELSNNFAILQSALVSGGRVVDFLDESEEIVSAKKLTIPHFQHALRFENVSFAYSSGVQAIHEVSFTVQRGHKVALVVHSGACKSTIIKLATRFYEPTSGRITIDEADVGIFANDAIRSLYNVVLQEVFLFAGTLRDNLRYGRPSASDDEILIALRQCQILDLVQSRGGLDTVVLSQGQNFSLGERQLFALARALIADPQILILDEATASIDRDTERRLQTATKEVLKDRTAIVIAHRLSTIKDCDTILVFHKGRIVERGSHLELLGQDGIYAKLIALQERENATEFGEPV